MFEEMELINKFQIPSESQDWGSGFHGVILIPPFWFVSKRGVGWHPARVCGYNKNLPHPLGIPGGKPGEGSAPGSLSSHSLNNVQSHPNHTTSIKFPSLQLFYSTSGSRNSGFKLASDCTEHHWLPEKLCRNSCKMDFHQQPLWAASPQSSV